VGVVAEYGSAIVTVSETTTFTLSLSGPSGDAVYTLTVEVGDAEASSWVIYDDSLHSPFGDHSWATATDLTNPEVVAAGTMAIRADYNAWGGLSIARESNGIEVPIALGEYDSLLFDVYSSASAPLGIGFQSTVTQNLQIEGGKWNRIAIALPGFEFSRFWFQNRGVGTWTGYFDNIRFLPSANKGPNTVDPPVPSDFSLSRNYPNPFNPETNIEVTLPAPTTLTLKVYDYLGREVATLGDGLIPAGKHVFRWDATGSASGIYFCRLVTPFFIDSIVMTHVK
jgi:hypothetical protein